MKDIHIIILKYLDSIINVYILQIEEKISIDTLDALKKAFAAMDEDRSGSLELDEFKKLLKKQLRLPVGKVCFKS